MRVGNREIPGGLLVMLAFVLVIAVLVLWAWYYYSKQKSEMQSLATSRGWKFLGKDSPELRQWLKEMDTDRSLSRNWRPDNIILVGDPSDGVYLFNYQADSHPGRASSELGAACLAERPDGQTGELVMIYHRSRLLGKLEEKLAYDKVEVGGSEFQQKFLVRSRQPDIAAATVTSGVEEVLFRQTSSLKWDRVWIAGRHVLVTVTLPLEPEEWDELLGITKRLRAALP
jgi:hypothetical protein